MEIHRSVWNDSMGDDVYPWVCTGISDGFTCDLLRGLNPGCIDANELLLLYQYVPLDSGRAWVLIKLALEQNNQY